MLAVFSVRPLSFPEAYYPVRTWEPRLYTKLGVRVFKKALQSRFWERRIPPKFRLSAHRTSLSRLETQMRHAETAHLLSFIFALPFAGYVLCLGRLDATIWVMSFNLLLNGYPVMVQRYNRARLTRLRAHRGLAVAPRKPHPEAPTDRGRGS
ncbi:MAG: glycosyl-4,4'-diaponeurosporenoate acyltransferase CrtO family protein [Planctomycetota bacterium]